jgi:hypothetical protein
MQPDVDPRKRPLLTPEQLRILKGIPVRTKKLTPREEFEKLFLRPSIAEVQPDKQAMRRKPGMTGLSAPRQQADSRGGESVLTG